MVVADVTIVEVVMVQENVQPSTSIHRRHGIRQKAVCTAATSNLLSVAMSEHKACKKEDARESTEQSYKQVYILVYKAVYKLVYATT